MERRTQMTDLELNQILQEQLAVEKENKEHLLQELQILRSQLDSMTQLFTTQTEVIRSLNETVTRLEQKIASLEEQKRKNSKNSSKPPSSDGYAKKPAPKSLRTSSGKKQGGQTGHEGTNLKRMEATETIYYMAPSCVSCPHRAECLTHAKQTETRQVIDIQTTTKVTNHTVCSVKKCMLSGTKMCGSFPADIKGPVQYGKDLQTLVTALNTIGAVSVSRVHEIVSGIFNIPISAGTITAMVHHCAELSTDTYEQIRLALIASKRINSDETGTRVDGKLHWVHNASNDLYTMLTVHQKRGIDGMIAANILPNYTGVAVHDCWKPYWNFPNITHAICNVHLLRELTGVMENHPEQTWAKSFMEMLLAMKELKEGFQAKGYTSMTQGYIWTYDIQYENILNQAYAENPEPVQESGKRGRKKRGKILALIDRLKNYKAEVCLFFKEFIIPFGNNQAEQDVRMVKVKTKVSGCFRSEEGIKDYLVIMSLVGTAKKRGMTGYDAIKNIFYGSPEVIIN